MEKTQDKTCNEFNVKVGRNGYLVFPDSYRSGEVVSGTTSYDFYVFETADGLSNFLKNKMMQPDFDFTLAMGKAIERTKKNK